MEFHPVANIFPLLQGDEYEALKADIAKNGLIEPIWLHPDGRILDGRNRWRACVDTNTNARTRFYEGDLSISALVNFVVSLNLKRRHLTSSQLAFVALEIEKVLAEVAKERQAIGHFNAPQYEQNPVVEIFPQLEKGKARDQAAVTVGTNGRYVQDAKKLAIKAPELAQKVRAGELTIPKAKKELRKRENVKKECLAKENAPATRLWEITSNQDIITCNAVITDPPYGILDEEWEPEELYAFTTNWLRRWNECQANFIVSFWSQRYLFDGKTWFDESLTNYRFQQLLIWHYPNNKSPQSRQGFKQTYEPIFFYRRLDSDKEIRVDGSAWGDGLNDFDCHVAAVPQSNFNDENFKQHPAQKPVSAMRWLVNALTVPGELVADPFCGSGTTGIAATQLLRKFYGIENDPEYLELATRRLSAYGR
jgi:DNA modification methylase